MVGNERKSTYIVFAHVIYPRNKWLLLGELLAELTKLEFRQEFLASAINNLPSIAQSLEMDINSLRIRDLKRMIDRLDKK